MKRRIFVTGVHGKTEHINLSAVRTRAGLIRLLMDIKSCEQQERTRVEARPLLPKMPKVYS